ncbi:DUF2510 domain-containing protein [Aeromicrobium wangtongii]|uniref:DUF2510 domain-containing protein n=1 Tax=Aeromicrobium wangtongii TaxID=2969247 RepID=A0ABY5M4F1_9ACTN|nr:DUF2510 domain-containing protein [Aeromicrobium wangtongii]MCD9198315.1 DUF2510 domain-containing protein [Aeromicrobium wangtongii]UUP12347.1 DUF2510 domain-containing protein [Aeromicrobium wangtongii]
MTDHTPSGSTRPGFYPDSSGTMRWWDGSTWTEHTQQAAAVQVAPAKKSHTFRNVMLGIIAAGVLVIAGCTALLGSAANEVGESIEKEEAKDQQPGGPDNPLTIVEGKKFSVLGFDYSGGWRITDDGLGSPDIKGLKVTNNRGKKDSALVEIKFMKGSEVLAVANCTTEPVAVGETTTLSCFSADELPKAYDRITINDSF